MSENNQASFLSYVASTASRFIEASLTPPPRDEHFHRTEESDPTAASKDLCSSSRVLVEWPMPLEEGTENRVVIDPILQIFANSIHSFRGHHVSLFSVAPTEVTQVREVSPTWEIKRMKELHVMLAVFQRSVNHYKNASVDIYFSSLSFLKSLEKQNIFEELEKGLRLSWEETLSKLKDERLNSLTEFMASRRSRRWALTILYAEVLFFYLDYRSQVSSTEDLESWKTFPSPSALKGIYCILTQASQHSDSYSQRLSMLLTGFFCIYFSLYPSYGSQLNADSSSLDSFAHSALQHFQVANSASVSHYVVLALLQTAIASPGTQESLTAEKVQLWEKMLPILQRGRMYDPDFSCFISIDGTRSLAYQRVKRVMGETMGRVWGAIYNSSYWDSMAYESQLSVCKGVHCFAYTWASCTPAGVEVLLKSVKDRVVALCQDAYNNASVVISTPQNTLSSAVKERKEEMARLLVLYAYVCATYLELSPSKVLEELFFLPLSPEQVEMRGTELSSPCTLTSQAAAALSPLFLVPLPIALPLNSQKVTVISLLGQYISYLQMELQFSQTQKTQSIAPVFEACITLFCSILGMIAYSSGDLDAQNEQLKSLEIDAGGASFMELLYRTLTVVANREQASPYLTAQVFSCVVAFQSSFPFPVDSFDFLKANKVAFLRQNAHSSSLALLRIHLFAAFHHPVISSSNLLPFQSLLSFLESAHSGDILTDDGAFAFYMTILRYIYHWMAQEVSLRKCAANDTIKAVGKRVTSLEGAASLSSVLNALLEGSAALFQRVSMGKLYAVEGSVQAALEYSLYLIMLLLQHSGNWSSLASLHTPSFDEALHASAPKNPGPMLMVYIVLSEETALSVKLIATELFNGCMWGITSPQGFQSFHGAFRSAVENPFLLKLLLARLKEKAGTVEHVFALRLLLAMQQFDAAICSYWGKKRSSIKKCDNIGSSSSSSESPSLPSNEVPIIDVIVQIVKDDVVKDQGTAELVQQSRAVALQLLLLVPSLTKDAAVKSCVHQWFQSLCQASSPGGTSETVAYRGDVIGKAWCSAVASAFLNRSLQFLKRKELVQTDWNQSKGTPSTSKTAAPPAATKGFKVSGSVLPPATSSGRASTALADSEGLGSKDLVCVVQEGCRQLRALSKAAEELLKDHPWTERNNLFYSVRDSTSTRDHPFEQPLLLGSANAFYAIRNRSQLCQIASLFCSVMQWCESLEQSMMLWMTLPAEDGGLTVASARKSVDMRDDLLEAILGMMFRVSSVEVGALFPLQTACLARCVCLAQCLAENQSIIHSLPSITAGGASSSGIQDVYVPSPSLAKALRKLATGLLVQHPKPLSFTTSFITILQPFPYCESEDEYVLEKTLEVIGRELLHLPLSCISKPFSSVSVAIPSNEETIAMERMAAQQDAFLEAAHLFVKRHGRKATSSTLRMIITALVQRIDPLTTHIVIGAGDEVVDVWVRRIQRVFQFLRTLLILHPSTALHISKPVVMSLAAALAQLEYLPPVIVRPSCLPSLSSAPNEQVLFSLDNTKKISLYAPCAALQVYYTVLDLLLAVVVVGGRDGIFSAAKTGWIEVILPLCFSPRFQRALSCFTVSTLRAASEKEEATKAPESAAGLCSWEIWEVVVTTQLVALLSALGASLQAVRPLIVAGFREVESGQHFQRFRSAIVPGHTESKAAEAMEKEHCISFTSSILRNQLSVLVVQPNVFPPIECAESISFAVLYKFIVRQLRAVQRFSKSSRSSSKNIWNQLPMLQSSRYQAPRELTSIPLSSQSSLTRSPSMETMSMIEADETSVIGMGKGTTLLDKSGVSLTASLSATTLSNQEAAAVETIVFYVETVELALALFAQCANERLSYVKSHTHLPGKEDLLQRCNISDLVSSGKRLVHTLDHIEKSLEEGEAAGLIPFVKTQRRTIQKIIRSF